MKIAKSIIAEVISLDDQSVMNAFNAKFKEFEIEGVEVINVDSEDGDTIVTFSDEYENDIDVLFTIEEDGTPTATILDDGENPEMSDELTYVELLNPNIIDLNDYKAIDLTDLSWMDEDTLLAILTDSDEYDDSEEDLYESEGTDELDERFAVVIRKGKKVKKKLVRRKRKKRLSAKRRAGIRRGVRKRKKKAKLIARKRKKSLKLRKRLKIKKNKNRKLRVVG